MTIEIDNYGYCKDCYINYNCPGCDRMTIFTNKNKKKVKESLDKDKIKVCEECCSLFFGEGNLCYNCLRK